MIFIELARRSYYIGCEVSTDSKAIYKINKLIVSLAVPVPLFYFLEFLSREEDF